MMMPVGFVLAKTIFIPFFHHRANGDGATVPVMKTNYWTGLSIAATTVTVSTMTTTPGD